MVIRHSLVATAKDEAGAEVNKAEWNDDHVIDNGTLSIAKTSGLQTALDGKAASSALNAKSPIASPTFTGTVVLPNVPAIVTTELDLKSPIASPTFTGTVTTASLDVAGNNIDNIQNLIHDISTTTSTLDFTSEQLQIISISSNITFTTSNIVIGKSKTIKITTDGSTRNLTFPSGWKFIGAKPTEQEASKIGILTMTSFGSSDSDIVAAYAVEE